MSGRGEVLDRNLELLLRRAYLPALPDPLFRERLRTVWLGEHERRTRGPARPGSFPARGRRTLARPLGIGLAATLAAAAAILLLLRAGGGRVPPAEPALLAGGVHRASPDAPWTDIRGPLRFERHLEVATRLEPCRVEGHGGTVLVAAESRVLLEAGSPPELELLAGGVEVELASDLEWSVSTPEGALRLRGAGARLALEIEDEGVAARLDAGAATLARDGTPLEAGSACKLVGGRIVTPPAPLADAGRRAVETVPAGPAPAVAGPGEEGGEGTAARRLSGRVLDADGAPVTSFRLGILGERIGPSFQAATTRDVESSDGSFVWEDLPPGPQELFVHAEGHALYTTGLLDVADAPELLVRLVRGGEVRGLVTDATTGLPLANVSVLSERDLASHGVLFSSHGAWSGALWTPARASSDPTGAFHLEHLSPGRHALKLDLPGYAPAWIDVDVEEGRTSPEVEVSLDAGGGLEGRVVGDDGRPEVGAQVVASLMEGRPGRKLAFTVAVSDADGRYAFEDLPTGSLLVILIGVPGKGSHEPRVRPVAIERGRVAHQDFGGRVGTRVVGTFRGSDGAPIPFHNLALFEKQELLTSGQDWIATTSDAAGAFVFEGVEPGEWLAFRVADDAGTVQYVGEVTVHELAEERHDLVGGHAAVRGRITSGVTGEAVGGAVVILSRLEPQAGRPVFAGTTKTLADGTYAYEGLPHGRYLVTAYPLSNGLGFERSDELLLDEASPEADLDVAVFPGSHLTVLTVDPAGRPVEHVGLELVDELGVEYSPDDQPFTDAGGRKEIPNVRTGHFSVRAWAEGRATTHVPYESVAGRDATLRIVLTADGPATSAGDDR